MRTISAKLIQRLQQLEENHCLRENQPVMLLPAFISVSEWSTLAGSMQKILKENITEPIAPDYGGLPQLKLVECR